MTEARRRADDGPSDESPAIEIRHRARAYCQAVGCTVADRIVPRQFCVLGTSSAKVTPAQRTANLPPCGSCKLRCCVPTFSHNPESRSHSQRPNFYAHLLERGPHSTAHGPASPRRIAPPARFNSPAIRVVRDMPLDSTESAMTAVDRLSTLLAFCSRI